MKIEKGILKVACLWIVSVTNCMTINAFHFSGMLVGSSSSSRQNVVHRWNNPSSLVMTATSGKGSTATATTTTEEMPYDYQVPEDAVVHIKPMAMRRLRELRDQQMNDKTNKDEYLILRMGVRSGGCSGMSYVMDFTTIDDINKEGDDDMIDTYEDDKIQCVVDCKSMLYLYGLQLDYSTALIGGGFKFYNPNAEESCGCGSSFGV